MDRAFCLVCDWTYRYVFPEGYLLATLIRSRSWVTLQHLIIPSRPWVQADLGWRQSTSKGGFDACQSIDWLGTITRVFPSFTLTFQNDINVILRFFIGRHTTIFHHRLWSSIIGGKCQAPRAKAFILHGEVTRAPFQILRGNMRVHV